MKPVSRSNENWPKISFFGIYDGHAGDKCCEFLKDNLHQYIFRQASFPKNPILAIHAGIAEAEKKFIQQNRPKNNLSSYNKSGSCALITIFVGKLHQLD